MVWGPFALSWDAMRGPGSACHKPKPMPKSKQFQMTYKESFPSDPDGSLTDYISDIPDFF